MATKTRSPIDYHTLTLPDGEQGVLEDLAVGDIKDFEIADERRFPKDPVLLMKHDGTPIGSAEILQSQTLDNMTYGRFRVRKLYSEIGREEVRALFETGDVRIFSYL